MSNLIKFALLLVGAIVITMIVRVVITSANHPGTGTRTVLTRRVRVSAADLPMGLLLRDEDLTWKDIAATSVPPNAIVDGTPGAVDLKGACLLRHPVAGDTVIGVDDVILPNASGFLAATLKPGLRAISVAVDDVSDNAGLIQPGDYVDVLLTQQMTGRTDSAALSVASETVVEHVRVLAVGSEIQRPKDGSTDNNNTGNTSNRARTVTLEVMPRMTEVLAVAARLGQLSLALRSFATESRDPASNPQPELQPPPVWAGDVSRAVSELPRARAVAAVEKRPAAKQSVTIYRGSQKSDSVTSDATSSNATSSDNSDAGTPPLPAVPMPR